jgi:sulfide:quinone oxidoreductase
MMLPAFRGVEAVRDIEGLTNPRGFVLVDKHPRNPAVPNERALGVGVAIPLIGTTSVPVGVLKTGFMIESRAMATAMNIASLDHGQVPHEVVSWNAVCLADFRDSGVAFVAQPQIPPRNVNWSSSGKWVHFAKIGFEKYSVRKIRIGKSEPFFVRLAPQVLGIDKLKSTHAEQGRRP